MSAACGAAALAGLAAGVVAVLATVIVERFGGIAGGLIVTVPTTIVPAAAGLASMPDFAASMHAIPALMLVNAIVLLGWRWLPPQLPAAWSPLLRVGILTSASVTIWALCATLVAFTPPLHGLTAGIISTLVIAGLGVALCYYPLPGPKGSRPATPVELAARGIAAGLSISAAVGIGSVSDVVGGVVATFPSIFLTTMVSLALAHGEAVPLGATGTMILGSTAVASYALLAAALVPAIAGNVAGALAAAWFVAVVGVSVPCYAFVVWRQSVAVPGGSDISLLQFVLGYRAPTEDALDRDFDSDELSGLNADVPRNDPDSLEVIRLASMGPQRAPVSDAPKAPKPGASSNIGVLL